MSAFEYLMTLNEIPISIDFSIIKIIINPEFFAYCKF